MTSIANVKGTRMNNRRSGFARGVVTLMATALISVYTAATAWAGIPAPDLVLYGKVFSGNELLTTGELQWTYAPTDGSQPVVVSTSLKEIIGPMGGAYSYVIQIPAEQVLDGVAPGESALPLSTQPLRVNRSATLDGMQLFLGASALGETVTLTLVEHAGSSENVDLDLIDPDDCCPGDANRDGFVNLNDYTSVRDHFGDATPALGDASCDGFVNLSDYLSVRDNLGANCEPDTVIGRSTVVLGGDPSLMYPFADVSEVNVEREFEVSIAFLPGNNEAAVVGAFMEYNPALLDFIGGEINKGAFNSAEMTTDPWETVPGRITVSGGASSSFGRKDIVVATLTFKALKEGTATISLVDDGPFAAAALDGAFKALPVSVPVNSLDITVRGGASDEFDGWVIF